MAVKISKEYLETFLSSHNDVPGVSVAVAYDYATQGISGGFARVSNSEEMTPRHFLQCASLSKTIAAAFAVEYFSKRGIEMTMSVNELLSQVHSPWRIALPPSSAIIPPSSCDCVNLAMLVNHTALGMHYVYGIPNSKEMPSSLEFISGSLYTNSFGYNPLYLEREPGEKFSYSGGGFLVLQHILETMEGGKSIESIMRDFLDQCDMQDFTFSYEDLPGVSYAYGHVTRSQEVQPADGGRLKFPSLAAGALGTPSAVLQFLCHLGKAYNDRNGSGAISHRTARLLMDDAHLIDKGAVAFMRAKVGLGVFVATAGPNKIMLHQAANDGFRGVYMVCFDGPDAGKGFVILSNGDNPAVFMQCELCRILLTELAIDGIDFNRIASSKFSMVGLKQETIVNLGLKELVMAAFEDPYCDVVLSSNSKGISKL